MIEKDFILRIIQELGDFIARLINLKKLGQPSKAYDEIKMRIPKITGLDFKVFICGENGMDDLKIKDNDPIAYQDARGQFFLVAGELCLDLNERAQAQRMFEAAMHYYSYAESQSKTYSFQRQVDMDKLKGHLDRMVSPTQ